MPRRDSTDSTVALLASEAGNNIPILITWDGPRDPQNPRNFPFSRKLLITFVWVFTNWATNIASSIYSSGASGISREFHVSPTVTSLGISLFLIGYTVGPPCWGPLSERFGRKWPTCVGLTLFTLSNVPIALATNLPTVLIGRFFSGSFGAAPLTIFGGGLVDIWDPVQRGTATAGCLGAIFASIISAPVAGNFVAAAFLGWRWTIWLCAIMGLSAAVVAVIALPETHTPTLLRWKAAAIREQTGINARSEHDGQMDAKTVFQIYLVRSFKMLVTEPILVLITIYQAFVYGILYLVFVSYPIAFREVRHWSLGVSGLAYLSLVIGVLLGALLVIAHSRTHTAAKLRRDGVIIPEQRLPLMCVGGCLFPAGLLVFAWTSDPRTSHWAWQVLGGIPVAAGLYVVFNQCFNYMIDTYVSRANSAIGANTFVRSFFGASFPLFGSALYHRLGIAWATSLLAFVGFGMIPIPLLFYKYGRAIRLRSKTVENKS